MGMVFWLRGLKSPPPDTLWLRPCLGLRLTVAGPGGGTRIILIFGSTLIFFGGGGSTRKEAPGNWKMEGRIQT